MTTATTAFSGVEKHAPARAPFLVWPVARREFYTSICVALLPALSWGIVVFGWRVLAVLIVALAGATLEHFILFRFTRRGKCLVYAQTALGVLLLVALMHPLWPGWIVAVSSCLIPLGCWIMGGPGREYLHPSALLAIFLTALVPLIIAPALQRELPDAVLARDRLFMGDIRSNIDVGAARWLRARDLDGNDAMRAPRPDASTRDLFADMSALLTQAPMTGQGGNAPAIQSREFLRQMLDDSLIRKLPSFDLFLLGVRPGPVGTVGILGILFGGLYLAYRHILRFRSAAAFLVWFSLAQLFTILSFAALRHLGLWGAASVLSEFGGDLFILWIYSTLSSDMLFAAVFILALPGTEPLTPGGRRWFLVVAALLAAILHRINLPILPATTALLVFMPFRHLFDRLFAHRSWLAR